MNLSWELWWTASLDENHLDSPFQLKSKSHIICSENQTLPAAKSCLFLWNCLLLLLSLLPTEITFGFRIWLPICPSGLSSSQRPNFALDEASDENRYPLVTAKYTICPPIAAGFLPWTVVQYSTRPSHGWTSIFYHPQFCVPECSPTLCDHAVEISGSTWMRWFFLRGKRAEVRWYDDKVTKLGSPQWFGMVPKQVAGFICLTLTWIYVSFKQPTNVIFGGCLKV